MEREDQVGKRSRRQRNCGQDERQAEGAHGPGAQVEKVAQRERVVSGILREQRGDIRRRERGDGRVWRRIPRSRSQRRPTERERWRCGGPRRVADRRQSISLPGQPAADHQGDGRQRGQRVVFLAGGEAEEDHDECGPYARAKSRLDLPGKRTRRSDDLSGPEPEP